MMTQLGKKWNRTIWPHQDYSKFGNEIYQNLHMFYYETNFSFRYVLDLKIVFFNLIITT